MQIDLVYLWVDGSDTEWLQRRNAVLSQSSQYAKDSISDCRFIDNNELKYSLRSVKQNAPWINNIYIVTDNQIPKWLNLNNDRIKIIDLTEIVPNDKLPLFNSCAIETRLPFIPNLSEHFLYANDDMFFWNPTEETFFFNNNKTVFRIGKKIQNRTYKHIYGYTINRAYKLIKERFGCDIPYFPHHGIDAYKKSLFMECINEFQQEFEETLNHKIREYSDIQRVLVSYYMHSKGMSCLKRQSLIDIIFRRNPESECYNLKKSNMKKIINSKAKLMCINDCRNTTNEDREEIGKILEKKFPAKSEFEKQ